MQQNLHTHTNFCDGKNTAREMVEKAIALGFTSLGFSSHANTPFHEPCELGDQVESYRQEVLTLKKEYAEKLHIFLGTELDYYSAGLMPESYDYKIASVHYAVQRGEMVSYDTSVAHSESAIARLFNGDGLAYAKAYYDNMADMPNKIHGDFVGHFDLLTKFDARAPYLFDADAPKYRQMALDALIAVLEKMEFFEVNTGVIGRGYRNAPYPAPFLLDEMKARNCKMLITTDCHNKDFLNCGFDLAVELLRAHGFTEIYDLSEKGFIGRKI